MAESSHAEDYETWTKSGLMERVRQLETQLRQEAQLRKEKQMRQETQLREEKQIREETQRRKETPQLKRPMPASQQADAPPPPPKMKRKIDPQKYSTRHIALKLAYLGKNYGGFEHQVSSNQPSIEDELWKALTRACLIFPEDANVLDFECCEYSKCGRTDRGVSAFGQVIGLRVRSNRPRLQQGEEQADTKPFDDVADEICYPRILNRILPPDIRILAWCPAPPADFSARFSCRERQYRYFFTQPAFAPPPEAQASSSSSAKENSLAKSRSLAKKHPPLKERAPVKSGWLDIAAMREAAKLFEGEHDFRNFCKIDSSKQITNFRRRIFESDIVQVPDDASTLPYLHGANFAPRGIGPADGPHPRVYYFCVRGSAFLWHQIRHMVAVLFLVGQGLERASVVSELLDVERHAQRPNYNMADYVPLVLWDCIFPDLQDGDASEASAPGADSLDWVYVGDDQTGGAFGRFGLVDDIWGLWRQHKMDEVLAGQLLRHITRPSWAGGDGVKMSGRDGDAAASVRVFEGGNHGRLGGKYVPVMDKVLQETVEEQNNKYARRKGYASAEDMRTQKAVERARREEEEEQAAAEA